MSPLALRPSQESYTHTVTARLRGGPEASCLLVRWAATTEQSGDHDDASLCASRWPRPRAHSHIDGCRHAVYASSHGTAAPRIACTRLSTTGRRDVTQSDGGRSGRAGVAAEMRRTCGDRPSRLVGPSCNSYSEVGGAARWGGSKAAQPARSKHAKSALQRGVHAAVRLASFRSPTVVVGTQPLAEPHTKSVSRLIRGRCRCLTSACGSCCRSWPNERVRSNSR